MQRQYSCYADFLFYKKEEKKKSVQVYCATRLDQNQYAHNVQHFLYKGQFHLKNRVHFK